MKEYRFDDPRIQANPSLRADIEAAEPILSEVLGRSAGLVKANWSVSSDSHRPVVYLRLSDWTCPEGVEDRLSAGDFSDKYYVRRWLHDLWGKLIHAGADQKIKELEAKFPLGSSS